MESKINQITNSVLNCHHCQPLSGCVLSDLKSLPKEAIRNSLQERSRSAFERLLTFHESCPYRGKLLF